MSTAHWKTLFEGPLATVTADARNTVAIEREVIPIVFVPGIMGSRLKRTDGGSGENANVVWDPDSKRFLARLVVLTSQEQLRENMIGAIFDGDYLSVVGRTNDGALDEADRALSDDYEGFPGAFERGWSGVYQASYVPFLKHLTNAEWSEPVRHCFELPVHAFAYNWTQSNIISGRQLAKYVRETVQHYTGLGRECRHVILVSHSMGGLVSRACVHELKDTELLLGVIHGAQPAPGAVNAYWRMKGGMEDTKTALALGASGPKTTLLLGSMPGGLELLPNNNYLTNASSEDGASTQWLEYEDPGTGVPVQRPQTGNTYAEIYRERRQFWRLVDESWLDPARPLGAWERYLIYLSVAEGYHNLLDGYAHPDTVQFYASDVPTQDRIEFTRRTNRAWNWKWKFWRGGYSRGVRADGTVWDDEILEVPAPVGLEEEEEGGGILGGLGRLWDSATSRPDWLMYLEVVDALGDGTVSDGSGSYLDLGDDERTVRIGEEEESNDGNRVHQDAYAGEAARHVSRMAIENLCLKRIDDEVGPASGASGPSGDGPGGPGAGASGGGAPEAPGVAPPEAPASNEDIRQWYNDETSRIPALDEQWQAEGLSAEERARRAYDIRHSARMQAREMMADPAEVQLLRERDLAKYGNPDGPTFDQLVTKARDGGASGDDAFDSIIGSSTRTDPETNRRFGPRGQ